MSQQVQVRSSGEAHDHDDVAVNNTAGGVVLLPENEARLSALIINTGAADMRVTTDGSAPTATHGKRIAAGASLGLSGPNCPTKEIKAIREDATDTTANASEVD